VRRLLAVLAGVLALTGLSMAPASAGTLNSCLAQHRVCVSSNGRALISRAQQTRLEQQIGSQPIYLVVAASGSAGYDSAMRQIIRELNGHDQFTVGFLDSRQKHFGAYSRGMLPSGIAAGIATQVVRQHQAEQDIFAALTDFVRDVRQGARSAPASLSGGGATSSPSPGGRVPLIVLGVVVVLAALSVFLIARPRRKRRRQELREARSAAQDDLIALSDRVTHMSGNAGVRGNPDAAAEQAAALGDYERGTQALDAARRPGDMVAVSRAIGAGQYHLACAEALANGRPRPPRRPSCFFDPRHGMSVTDISWAPPDGSAARLVPTCADCARKVEQGTEPDLRTVEVAGAPVAYVNSGFAPAYWSGYGFGGNMFTGFLLGQALAPQPVIYEENFYGGDLGNGNDFGGGDFGNGNDFGGGDLGNGNDFGGGDFGNGSDFGTGGDDFGGGGFS
jgi:hypothetical protein